MGRYYGTHVWRAAITDLHSVPVEKLIIFMVRGKVFVQQCKELFSNVGGDGCIEGWVIVDEMESLNSDSLCDSSESRFSIIMGICLMIFGG